LTLQWFCLADVPFSKTKLMINSNFKNESINKSTNGRELSNEVGLQLAKISIESEKQLKASGSHSLIDRPVDQDFELKELLKEAQENIVN
jgi:hypothetical protein